MPQVFFVRSVSSQRKLLVDSGPFGGKAARSWLCGKS